MSDNTKYQYRIVTRRRDTAAVVSESEWEDVDTGPADFLEWARRENERYPEPAHIIEVRTVTESDVVGGEPKRVTIILACLST